MPYDSQSWLYTGHARKRESSSLYHPLSTLHSGTYTCNGFLARKATLCDLRMHHFILLFVCHYTCSAVWFRRLALFTHHPIQTTLHLSCQIMSTCTYISLVSFKMISMQRYTLIIICGIQQVLMQSAVSFSYISRAHYLMLEFWLLLSYHLTELVSV